MQVKMIDNEGINFVDYKDIKRKLVLYLDFLM